jgi:hypothetical protein
VVIVAPHFPPSNLAAVHRSRLFAMHLPKFGWHVRVLSVDPRYYEEPPDPELERLLPPRLEVVRTRALPTRPLRLVGDVGIRALYWHHRALRRMIEAGQVDLVYIPIPPNFTALLGPLLHARHGTAYAIDYIDPWVHSWPGCELRFSKAWWAFNLGRLVEPLVLRHVSLVTAVGPGYYDGALERSPWLDPSRCVAMPYGAEEGDFDYLRAHPRPPTLFDPADGCRHLVYAGAMLPRAYETLQALLNALTLAVERSPRAAGALRLHFVGTGADPKRADSSTIRPWIRRAGLDHVVQEHPARLPYLDALNHLVRAHAVIILGSSEPHYTASKIFQAVLSRRPVLGLLHEASTAAAILREAGAGPVVTFDEAQPVSTRVDEICGALLEIACADPGDSPAVRWEAFRAYSAERMAEQLAAAFDEVMARQASGT